MKILLIATGGTIASKETKDGLEPSITAEELLTCVPELSSIAEIDAMEAFHIDSTNISPEHWKKLSCILEEQYERYDGFVITHGTDTLSYTGAALNYMVQHSKKPIVLTGSQKSIYQLDTDARSNLFQAVRFAAEGRQGGVFLAFDSKVILGSRARKIRTRSYNAFESLDYPPVAVFRGEELVSYFPPDFFTEEGETVFYHDLNPRVAVMKLSPGLPSGILLSMAERTDALVLESFGMGGVPDHLLHELEECFHLGTIVVLTTQVLYEGSDLGVYAVGRRALRSGRVLEGFDMGLECIVTKLMWILASDERKKNLRKIFYQKIGYDLLKGEESLTIRTAQKKDLTAILEIFESARRFMEKTGNPNQWGKKDPSEENIKEMIESRNLRVMEELHRVAGVFYYAKGPDPDYEAFPGDWEEKGNYAVLHRVAMDEEFRGMGLFSKMMKYVLESAEAEGISSIRIDTHRENAPMRKALKKAGFREGREVLLPSGKPRILYELPLRKKIKKN